MKFREVIKILEDNGGVQKAVRGSHYQYTHPWETGKDYRSLSQRRFR